MSWLTRCRDIPSTVSSPARVRRDEYVNAWVRQHRYRVRAGQALIRSQGASRPPVDSGTHNYRPHTGRILRSHAHVAICGCGPWTASTGRWFPFL